jgi:hypothetical protein
VSARSPPVRSITVGVRLDHRLHYLAELAARKQRRSLSSFLEWAVKESLQGSYLLAAEADELWHPDKAKRFARLASRYPELLTYQEEVIWKRFREERGVLAE